MDSEEERQTRREKKKGSLGLDEPAQVLRARAVSSSGARSSTDPIPQSVVQITPEKCGGEIAALTM